MAAAAVVAAVVDDEDGVQWQRWGVGCSMAVAAFDGNGNVLQIGNGEAKLTIDTNRGGWQRQLSAFASSDGQRWVLVFHGQRRQWMAAVVASDNRDGV